MPVTVAVLCGGEVWEVDRGSIDTETGPSQEEAMEHPRHQHLCLVSVPAESGHK